MGHDQNLHHGHRSDCQKHWKFHRSATVISQTWQRFLSALYPPKCLICFRPGQYLCEEHHSFEKNQNPFPNYVFLDEIFAVANYNDPVAKKLIERFKFGGMKQLKTVIAQTMVDKKSADFFANQTVVPIPLHWTRKIWRGFNQAHLIAEAIQAKVPSAHINSNLKRRRKTNQQAKLQKSARFLNMKDAFIWQGNNIPDQVILIDDIATTGATLDAAARTLKKIGVKKVTAIVFAHGQ